VPLAEGTAGISPAAGGARSGSLLAGTAQDETAKGAAGLPASIDDTLAALAAQDYVADRSLGTVVFLSLKLGRPLFLEGEPGTGKTEIARTLAAALGRPLIRLQCYEGLDLAGAAYEWNYARQMLEIRLAESGANATAEARAALASRLFSDTFLVKRALLDAIDPTRPVPPVLLIDELDRADEPFEAFLLEVLADFQITIPEMGTVKAITPPIVVLTSNRTREIHDAVKRRCLYHWVGFPDAARELEILRRKVPGAPERLAREIVAFVQRLREIELYKLPGVAETIEWTRALRELDTVVLDPEVVQNTLGLLLKYQDDIARVGSDEVARLIEQARTAAA
jgi:MoxR-like ATPase